jgi:hypothetical protein
MANLVKEEVDEDVQPVCDAAVLRGVERGGERLKRKRHRRRRSSSRARSRRQWRREKSGRSRDAGKASDAPSDSGSVDGASSALVAACGVPDPAAQLHKEMRERLRLATLARTAALREHVEAYECVTNTLKGATAKLKCGLGCYLANMKKEETKQEARDVEATSGAVAEVAWQHGQQRRFSRSAAVPTMIPRAREVREAARAAASKSSSSVSGPRSWGIPLAKAKHATQPWRPTRMTIAPKPTSPVRPSCGVLRKAPPWEKARGWARQQPKPSGSQKLIAGSSNGGSSHQYRRAETERSKGAYDRGDQGEKRFHFWGRQRAKAKKRNLPRRNR